MESVTVSNGIFDIAGNIFFPPGFGENKKYGAIACVPPGSSAKEAEEAGSTDIALPSAVDYYRTARGHHERSSNQLRFTSVASLLAFDAFHLVEQLLTQPLQIVVGTGSEDSARTTTAMSCSKKRNSKRTCLSLRVRATTTCTTGLNMSIRLSRGSGSSSGKT